MKINIVHIHPIHVHHGMRGYEEIIETLVWGFQCIGCETTKSKNEMVEGCVNVLVGAQVWPTERLSQLPPKTIIYNLEQFRNRPADSIARYKTIPDHVGIWDYSKANFDSWSSIGKSAEYLPISYAPLLTKLKKHDDEYVDVLMYGVTSEYRLGAFHAVCSTGRLSSVFLCGLYGACRDQMIERSKIIVNTTLYHRSSIFEVARVSFLLANSKVVVSVREPSTFVEPDIEKAVVWANQTNLTSICIKLAADSEERRRLEKKGFDIFCSRTIERHLDDLMKRFSANLRLD